MESKSPTVSSARQVWVHFRHESGHYPVSLDFARERHAVLCAGAIGGKDHAAPVPFKTTGMVFTRILKSIHSDHWSMYCISRSIQWSNETELRPLICQRQGV